eukprot:2063528-Rhodomonas_salina.1
MPAEHHCRTVFEWETHPPSPLSLLPFRVRRLTVPRSSGPPPGMVCCLIWPGTAGWPRWRMAARTLLPPTQLQAGCGTLETLATPTQ